MRLDKTTGTPQGEGPLNQDHRKLEKMGEKGRYSGESGSQELAGIFLSTGRWVWG